MGVIDSLAGAIGGIPLLGTAVAGAEGIASYIGQKKTNQMSRDMSRENTAFQERMSSTAYQRGMDDMKKAGLNPILAGKLGGASTPGGAMPQFHSALGAGVQGFNSGLQSATNARNTEAGTALKNAQSILAENLEPGSEAISTLATGLRDVVQHIDSTMRKEGQMSKAVEALGLWFDAFVSKARQSGVEVQNMLEETLQGLDQGAQNLLRKVKDTFRNEDISYERE